MTQSGKAVRSRRDATGSQGGQRHCRCHAQTVKESISKDDAEKLKKELEAAGAKVEMKGKA